MLRLTRVVRANDSRGTAPEAPRTASSAPGAASPVTLAYEERRRSRWRARLDDGREIAVVLPRATVLRDGDRLVAEDAVEVVVVRAAAETLSVARTSDPHLLARAAYHLGNRHVPLQLSPGQVAYQHDHVLDGLVRELGLRVTVETAPFEPEAGGYRHEGSSGHAHGHGHGDEHHGDGHEHEHRHEHEHHHDHGE
jgi:urease accessory protein